MTDCKDGFCMNQAMQDSGYAIVDGKMYKDGVEIIVENDVEYKICGVCGVKVPKGLFVKQTQGKPLTKEDFYSRVCAIVESRRPEKYKDCLLKSELKEKPLFKSFEERFKGF